MTRAASEFRHTDFDSEKYNLMSKVCVKPNG